MPNAALMRQSARSIIDETNTLRTLNAFAVDLIGIPSIEDLFWYLAQNVVGRLNFVDCVIYSANKEQTELVQVAAWGQKNPFGRSIVNPLVIRFGEGITGQVANTHQAIIVDDLLKDQNYIPDTTPARSEICVPLLFRDRIVGVIDSEHPEPEAFGAAELEVLSTVAAMASAKFELLSEAQRSSQRYLDLLKAHAQLTEETSNRKALEAKLFEAKKLEVTGRLAGHFAHEFNNLLTVISGNLELIELSGDLAGSQELIEDSRSAAAKGAQVIRDMMAFSQRTHLEPKRTNLNAVLSAFCGRAEQILNISIKPVLADSLWAVSVDQSGFENSVLSLVVNAKEAMQDGGCITVFTDNITHSLGHDDLLASELLPGRYVRVTVADTGIGIPKERLSQIFDPFYSSKGLGVGMGLGLSAVFGFVKKSGGVVTVVSEVGRGSRFMLYFPAASDSVGA